MAKRIVTALVIVGVLLVGYWAYVRYGQGARLRDGEVVVSDTGEAPADTAPSASNTTGAVYPAAGSQAEKDGTPSASLPQLTSSQAQGSRTRTGTAGTDSQAPNAPNGAAFAGSGRYQIYRQGNLTWRVNTDDGTTCILFATDEEWRKPAVYSHGCPNS